MSLPAPVNKDAEELLDMLAYILATNSITSYITWIVGDVGMGDPRVPMPFGYISLFSEQVKWMTASGGTGGLAAPGPTGLDDWLQPIVITVAFAPHEYAVPIAAAPSGTNAFTALGPLPFREQPGYRTAFQINQKVKAVLRTNITLGGEAATTRITEARYVLQAMGGKTYRAARVAIQSQQRRVRGT